MGASRAILVAFAAMFMLSVTSLAEASTATHPIGVAPSPIYVGPWDGSPGSGTWVGYCGTCGPIFFGYSPSPLYVVNQGPDYSGPALTIPFSTYSPKKAYVPAINYPYVGGYDYYPHQ